MRSLDDMLDALLAQGVPEGESREMIRADFIEEMDERTVDFRDEM